MKPSLRWLLALCVLMPGIALADARLEARRHFRTGMELIDEGDFERGIGHLKRAYAIKPHPNVLYNIGRAYQDAGQLLEALDYYKRYLAAKPPDAATVQTTVERLEASLPKPPPVEAPVVVERRPSREESPISAEQLRRFQELMDRLESAVAKAEAPPARAKDELPAPDERPASSLAGSDALEVEGEAGAAPYEEVVVTASRRAQSTLEAPNSITIITAEEIRLSGATNLPELLRRVPGADVMAMGVGSYNVSFRGFNQRLANKVLVLVDGRPEWQDFLGFVLWPGMPIGLEEIERIEVIRGPGSALYGANAMLGVINIITRTPGAGPKAELSGRLGFGATAGGSFVASGGEKALKYRAGVGFEQANKWSRDYDDHRPDVSPASGDTALGMRAVHGSLTATYDFAKDVQLSAYAGVNRLYTELYPLGILRNFYLDGVVASAKSDLAVGPVKVKFFWNHLSGESGPEYPALGQRSVKTFIQSQLFDLELLFSKRFELAGEHNFNIGISGRFKRVAFDYLDDTHSEIHGAAFLSDEWRIFDPLFVVASYRLDRHPLLDQGAPGYAHSPRVSLLFKPGQNHALRASFATAFREPTFVESYMSVRVPVPGVNGASLLSTGDTKLKPEQLLSFELGYRGDIPEIGLEWDLSVYQNNVRDLIALSNVTRTLATEAWDEKSQSYLIGRTSFHNEPDDYTGRGVELGLRLSPIDGLDVKLSGAYQGITTSGTSGNICIPCTSTPAFKMFAGVGFRTPIDLDFSADVSYVTSTLWIEREPLPSDPTVFQNLQYPVAGFAVVNARIAYRFLQDRVIFAVVGSQLGPSHPEHPFGNRVERRVLGTLTVIP